MSVDEIRTLLNKRAELKARLNIIPYDGTVEVKEIGEEKYIYIRKRVSGKLTSTYVNVYSDALFNAVTKTTLEARALKKELRQVEKQLVFLGHNDSEKSNDVLKCIDLARLNLKANIYDQAVLEGIATTFPQTEEILNSGIINGISTIDVIKILNLKHAWEFILEDGVLESKTDINILMYIARLINENLVQNGGKVRSVPVSIRGSSFMPPLPIESEIKEEIEEIVSSDKEKIEIAIDLLLYTMKRQIFLDGNKRTAVIFTAHYMISNGLGLIVIPYEEVNTFRNLLVLYYEGKGEDEIRKFLKEKCYRKIEQ